MDFPGGFILPEPPMLQRPFEGNRPGTGTVINTATTVPAFIGVQDNRRLAFHGMGYINIYLAGFHTMVTPVTDFWIENHRTGWCSDIRQCG